MKPSCSPIATLKCSLKPWSVPRNRIRACGGHFDPRRREVSPDGVWGRSSLALEPLAKGHDRQGFTCGVESLDAYLRIQASQDMRRKANAVFVLVPENIPSRIAGYLRSAPMGSPLGSFLRQRKNTSPLSCDQRDTDRTACNQKRSSDNGIAPSSFGAGTAKGL